MRTWLGLAMTTVVSGFSVGACTTTVADKYPGSDNMCADVAKEECQISSICAAPTDACIKARQAVCQSDLVGKAVGGGRKYTPGLAEACVTKTHEIYTLRIITPTDTAAQADTCNRVFQGTAATGAPCTTDYDCTGTAVCTAKFCGPKLTKKLGEGCANAGEVCDTGTYCPSVPQPRCTARKAAGETCDAGSPCLETLKCNTTCGARFDSGHSCANDNECSTSAPYCDLNATTGPKCAAGIVFAPDTPICKKYGGS